jgi:7,8-dihydropterin-6-yl-methyl-4-(beta-D-ribofuranosyl)aminobenzene 5'-phosphate synthase
MKIKIIFDKDTVSKGLKTGWGVSILIGDKVLFDTAEKGEYLLDNIKALGLDIGKIESVIISHNHWDHRAGLWDLLKIKSSIVVYACSDFISEFAKQLEGYSFKEVSEFEEIAEGIYTTGCFSTLYKDKNLMEQALIVKSDKGVSLICGCSHPGILEMIEKAKKIFPKEKMYSCLGGFHLIDKDSRYINYIAKKLKEMKVQNLGPSHCSGFQAASILKELFGNDLFEVKAGMEIKL